METLCGGFASEPFGDDGHVILVLRGGGQMVLKEGQTVDITVNKPERDALDQVLRRLTTDLNEFERNQLQLC